jgi:signal peptide peptidase SppA
MGTTHSYEHLLGFALDHPWALTPPMLKIVADLLARRLAGESPDADAISAAVGARNRVLPPEAQTRGGIATIPIYGVIAPRMNLLSEMSGGTTFETLTGQLRAAVADPNTRAIVFDVDSPGGNVAGATEFSKEVRAARGTKPIVAVAHHLMASAAYWAMAGASEIVASPSAMVGSIGVYTIHDDISAALGNLGIKRSVFAAGKYKAEGADGGALSADAQTHVKALVDTAYGRMVADIATGRGVSAFAVKGGYGEGRTLDAEAALRAGLVNRIATVDEVFAQLDGRAAGVMMAQHRDTLAQLAMAQRRHELAALTTTRRLQ